MAGADPGPVRIDQRLAGVDLPLVHRSRGCETPILGRLTLCERALGPIPPEDRGIGQVDPAATGHHGGGRHRRLGLGRRDELEQRAAGGHLARGGHGEGSRRADLPTVGGEGNPGVGERRPVVAALGQRLPRPRQQRAGIAVAPGAARRRERRRRRSIEVCDVQRGGVQHESGIQHERHLDLAGHAEASEREPQFG